MLIRFVPAIGVAVMLVLLAGCSGERVSEIVDGVRGRANQALSTGSPSEPTSPEPATESDDERGSQSGQMAQGVGFADYVNYPVGGVASSVTATDLDGDGDTDLATTNKGPDDVSVLINKGDGTFVAAGSYPVGEDPNSVTAADLDGDGDMDLVTTNRLSASVSVLINDGDGTFSSNVNYSVGSAPYSVTAADLDGDGDMDLAAANFGSDDVSVLINEGDGTFAAAESYWAGDDEPGSVTAADLDGDGDMDLAAANFDSDDVSVLINEGGGVFADDETSPVGYGPASVTASDLDSDGDTDLATVNDGPDDVSVLINEGDSTFAAAESYPVDASPTSLTASDLDGDGDTDLATANFLSENVSVLINTTRTGGDTSSSEDSVETSLRQAVGDYYRAAGAEEWTYTYDHLDSQTRSMFTEEEWSQKNQWFWDSNPTVYHILTINLDSASQEPLAEVEVGITGEDGSSWTRTTYFMFEDGEWKHRLSEAETDLFMPDATFEEFVEAQTGTSSDGGADGVCAGISGCEPVDSADVDGDGSLDEIALVGEPDEYSGERTQITVRALLADGTTLTRPAAVEHWYGETAWLGATDFGQIPGEELVIGGTSGAHTKWYRVLTYRDGDLVELPYPDSDTSYATMWPIDSALSAYMGVQFQTSDSTVVLRSVTPPGATSEDSTYEGEETSWVLEGGQWRMTDSRKLEYPDGDSASEIAGWQCGDLPRVYD